MDTVFHDARARWVWPAELAPGPNQFVEFVHKFEAVTTPDAMLLISADAEYVVRLNGAVVGFGQFSDYPDVRSYDTYEISGRLRPGSNELRATVWNKGQSFSNYREGSPGLIYVVDAGPRQWSSGTDTLYRVAQQYRSGPTETITPQLGFTFAIDASQAGTDEWHPVRHSDTTDLSRRAAPRLRPLPKLTVGRRAPAVAVAGGVFARQAAVPGATVAHLVQTDLLSPRLLSDMTADAATITLPCDNAVHLRATDAPPGSGLYIVLDLGREEAGLFEMEVIATAGQVIDIAWGEHLDDRRVRACVGGRNFAGRYVCREGRQTFTHHFTRIAGRYVELHVSDARAGFGLVYGGIRPTDYPVEERGAFAGSAPLLDRVYDAAVRTLRLCMHEHYEDCPWREQSLYASDSRNQALSGYYAFGEYAFPAISFDLLGRGLGPDGYLELCAPASIPVTIPGFSMYWIMELADHLLYSGDFEAAGRQYPRVTQMFGVYAATMREGLLPCPTGERYWHFYDWAPGLAGTAPGGAGGFETVERVRFDAPLNLLFCLALEAGAALARGLGRTGDADRYEAVASELRSAVRERFWSAERRLFLTYDRSGPTHVAEVTQSLALLSGAAAAGDPAALRRTLGDPGSGLVETTLSQSLYKFEALLMEPSRYGAAVFQKIAADWGHMLERGATSFWETMRGADDFEGAGSLCHGWSAIPAYVLSSRLLGIRPLAPGFARCSFAPVRGVLDAARGIVPTPRGPIRVSWKDDGTNLRADVEAPAGITVERGLY